MKKMLLTLSALTMLSGVSVAGVKAINPSLTAVPFHFLYRWHNLDLDNMQVELPSAKFYLLNPSDPNSTEVGVEEEGDAVKISMRNFLNERVLSRSVFRVGSAAGDAAGTAFLIGGNLVLTNNHVLGLPQGVNEESLNATQMAEGRSCGLFNAKLNDLDDNTLKCKKVHYCNVKQDFCLIELEDLNGAEISESISPLSLASKVKFNSAMVTTLIGNTYGFGIQASSGNGFFDGKEMTAGYVFHMNPMFEGSSGSPIFNADGIVNAINHSYSATPGAISDIAYNLGTSSEFILNDLNNFCARANKKEVCAKIKIDQALDKDLWHSELERIYEPSLALDQKKMRDSAFQQCLRSITGISGNAFLYEAESVAFNSNLSCLQFGEELSENEKALLKEDVKGRMLSLYRFASTIGSKSKIKESLKTCIGTKKQYSEECILDQWMENNSKGIMRFLSKDMSDETLAGVSGLLGSISNAFVNPQVIGQALAALIVEEEEEQMMAYFLKRLQETKSVTLTEKEVLFDGVSSTLLQGKIHEELMDSYFKAKKISFDLSLFQVLVYTKTAIMYEMVSLESNMVSPLFQLGRMWKTHGPFFSAKTFYLNLKKVLQMDDATITELEPFIAEVVRLLK